MSAGFDADVAGRAVGRRSGQTGTGVNIITSPLVGVVLSGRQLF